MPRRSLSSTTSSRISPRLPYVMMLPAISEMAVAMSVCSVREKPVDAASSRPFWRALTMSCSLSIGTRSSVGMTTASLPDLAQEQDALLEVERRIDAIEREAELHHGKGDVRLYPHDDRVGAAKLRRV